MKKKGKQIISCILLILLTPLWMVPVITVSITVLKSQGDFYSGNSLFSLPDQLGWSNSTGVWTKGRLGTCVRNGLAICLLKVPLGILVESLATFTITRLNIKHKIVVFVSLPLGMILPHQMVLIPLDCTFSNYNLTSNYASLFVAYTGSGIGYGILVPRGFMRSIPKDLGEAVYIDGCGKLRLYYSIMLLITKPAITTVLTVDLLNTWNRFLLQGTLIISDSLRTVPNGLMNFVGEYGTDYGLLNAGALVSIVLVLMVYLFFQKYFVGGMVGVVKQQEPESRSPANRRCRALKNEHEKESIMVYNNYHLRMFEGRIARLITNIDAKNKADDQYTIIHVLLSLKFDSRGIIVVHFSNGKNPHSMEDSYDKVLKILDLMGSSRDLAYKGADRRLPDEKTPVESQGTGLVIEEAMKESDIPLYVIFLGSLTDMASAYPIEPRIAGRLTCIWIGGGKYPEDGYEYNLNNSIESARVVIDSDMPIRQISRDVHSRVIAPLAELEYKVHPCRELGRHLFDQLEEHGYTPFVRVTTGTGEYRCLGDSPTVGISLLTHMFDYDWVRVSLTTDSTTYVKNSQGRPIRVYNRVDHRSILEGFYVEPALFIDKQQL